VFGKITYKIISNQKQNHIQESNLKSKSKSQGHNATFARQHLCAKIQQNCAVIQCAKNAYGLSVFSNMF